LKSHLSGADELLTKPLGFGARESLGRKPKLLLLRLCRGSSLWGAKWVGVDRVSTSSQEDTLQDIELLFLGFLLINFHDRVMPFPDLLVAPVALEEPPPKEPGADVGF
jgi:hypothetical protein